MLRKPIIIILACLFIFFGCNREQKETVEKPIARVYDLFLYPSDINDQMPSGVSEEDSLRIARRIIEEWVKDKLLLKKAEQFLAGSDYNIEKQLEDYRASLLSFKYKQEVLMQRLDTIINDKEIEKYYSENLSNYLLNADVVRLTYVKVPLTAPQISTLRGLYRSEKDEDLVKLEEYCMSHAETFVIQSPEWIRFVDFIKQIPLSTNDPGRYLTNNKNIEVRDSVYQYFIHIIEHIPEKKAAPIQMVASDIRDVLINKRKITLIQELESSVYNEGLSRNMAEIF